MTPSVQWPRRPITSMERMWRSCRGWKVAQISGSAMISDSFFVCIMPMMRCTRAEPLEASITSVSFIAGSAMATASPALL